VADRFESSDGIPIAHYAWGESAAARPPVILHHGFAVSARINWEAPGIVGALLDAGRFVLALDARGHGASGKPHDSACYGEDRMARDLSELADRLALTAFDLVGYSMGAIVSLIAATREPRIRRLVVGGVGAGVVRSGGVDTRAVDNRDIVRALLAEDGSEIPETARPFRRLADATGADRLALAAQARVVHSEPIALDAITAPTLVLAGDADPLASEPEKLAAAIPGARLATVPGDHLGAVADPGFAAALIRFLR
jgi:pimeloyl-ACP methyl ester carboxylesterase